MEGARLCQHLDLRLPASRTVREYISIVFSHQDVIIYYSRPRKLEHLLKRQGLAWIDLPARGRLWDLKREQGGLHTHPGRPAKPPTHSVGPDLPFLNFSQHSLRAYSALFFCTEPVVTCYYSSICKVTVHPPADVSSMRAGLTAQLTSESTPGPVHVRVPR